MATQDSQQQQAHWHFSQFEDENIKIRGRTLFTLVVLLSIGILATLLFFYVRWIWRRRNHPTVITLPIITPNRNLQGLDAMTINNLPIILYKSSVSGTDKCYPSDEITECCICLSVFGDGDKVKMLPQCRHCFHSECVDNWLVSHSSCPLCRQCSLGTDPTNCNSIITSNNT